jgi:hypothetical protein
MIMELIKKTGRPFPWAAGPGDAAFCILPACVATRWRPCPRLLAKLRVPTAPLVRTECRHPPPPTPIHSLVAHRGPSMARVDAAGSRSLPLAASARTAYPKRCRGNKSQGLAMLKFRKRTRRPPETEQVPLGHDSPYNCFRDYSRSHALPPPFGFFADDSRRSNHPSCDCCRLRVQRTIVKTDPSAPFCGQLQLA